MNRLTPDERAHIVARVAIAIQTANGDHLGPVETVHADFLRLLEDANQTRAQLERLSKTVKW